MNIRAAGLIGIALLLCGCSDADWDHALSYDAPKSSGPAAVQVADANASPPVEATASMPVPVDVTASSAPRQMAPADEPVPAPQPSYSVTQTVTTITPIAHADVTTGYCRKVAQNSGASATRDGMDEQAQQQAVDATYQQCLRFYGAPGQ